jgi:hypothetical protein
VLPTNCSCAKTLVDFFWYWRVERGFLTVLEAIWSRRKIYSCHGGNNNLKNCDGLYHFINFSRNRTGRRRLPRLKSTTAEGKGSEENGPVDPVESIMVGGAKSGISRNSPLSICFCFHPKKAYQLRESNPILISLIPSRIALAHVKRYQTVNPRINSVHCFC